MKSARFTLESITYYFESNKWVFSGQFFRLQGDIANIVIHPIEDDQHKYYYCPNNCGKRYKYKSGLHMHTKYECGVEPQFRCEVCLRRFTHRSHLRSHRLKKHKLV